MQKRIKWKSLLLKSVMILLIGFSAYLMVFRSALKWTFEQKEYWLAVGELSIIFVTLACVFYGFSKHINLCICATGCIVLAFCYLHAYFYAFVIGGLYMLFIYLLGRTIGEFMGLHNVEHTSGLFNITYGIAGELLLVSVLSILKIGTPHRLRIIFAVLFAVLLVINRRYLNKMFHMPKTALVSINEHDSKICAIIFAAIITMVLLQIGRANISLDYDSVWYGLRSEYMLAPYTGIYDKVTAAGLVYTYGKGIETLCLPFAGLTSFGFIYSVNLYLAIGILVCVHKICRCYTSAAKSLLTVLATAVTPGVMNMAVTAKSDIATTFLELVAIYAAIRAYDKERKMFGLAIGVCILSFAFKSSSFIFSSIIIFCIVAVMFIRRIRFECSMIKPLVLMSSACICIMGRTFYLTGCPASFLFPSLWEKLGLTIKEPYGWSVVGRVSVGELFTWDYFKTAVQRLLAILYAPITEPTNHVIIAWSGLLFVFALVGIVVTMVAKVVCGQFEPIFKIYPVIAIWILLSGASIGSIVLLTKPDGNYFELWYITTLIMASCVVNVEFIKSMPGLVLIGYGGLMTLATSWGWSLGLTPISFSNYGYYNSCDFVEKYMDDNHWSNIYHELIKEKPRAMLFSEKMQYDYFLPAIMDSWSETRVWGSSWITASVEEFLHYIQISDIQYIIVDQNYLLTDSDAKMVVEKMATEGYLQTEILEENHGLFKVVENPSSIDTTAIDFVKCNKVKVMSGVYEDSWATPEVELTADNSEPVQIEVKGQLNSVSADSVIEVYVDSNKQDEYILTDFNVDIVIPIESSGTHQILLKSNFSIKATPPDIRKDLSYILSSVEIMQSVESDVGEK